MAGAKFFVSKDGRVVRYIIQTRCDPYSRSAVDLVHLIQTVAQQALPNTTLAGASTSIIGYAAVIGELQQIYVEDFVRIVALTIIIVAAILALLLRAVLAPIYLVASVTLSYLSALGLGVVVFQVLLDNPIYWVVPALSFIVLIAVGADYNMLLISRLREESINNTRVGVIRAVKRTGAVITSAGIIFAACMFGLMAGSVSTVVQTGFIIGCGLLLDTFIVRTLTVPALATILGKANWWPSRK
jgi:RND superfamily putative drug exporter